MKTAALLATLVLTMFVGVAHSNISYCDGDGCPSRYTIQGFEVWASPTATTPTFTN